MLIDLVPKALARDEHFKGYQDLTGAALSSVSITLNKILEDSKIPLVREEILESLSSTVKLLSELFNALSQARKVFLEKTIRGRYEEKLQKVFKKVQSTSFLFGDNLRSLIETSKAMERVSEDLKPKLRLPLSSSALNWRSSTSRREVMRGNVNQYQTSRQAFPNNRQNKHSSRYKGPAKKYYTLSQPQRSKR